MQSEGVYEHKFSLDLSGEESVAYMHEFLKEGPRRLHRHIASDQLISMRVCHWTVRLVVRTLFHASDAPGDHADNIAAMETPGVFGHVRAYFGAVEPQMRKALHVHMLVQLLGFTHRMICSLLACLQLHSNESGVSWRASVFVAQTRSRIA